MMVACMLQSNKWWRKVVRVHCDNEAVVEVLQKGYARDDHLMHLLRSVCFYCILWDAAKGRAHSGSKVVRGSSLGSPFKRSNSCFPTHQGIETSLQAALVEEGYSAESYAGHSFRVGAATTASRCGLQML